jgi:hypothetical protein
MCRAEIFANRLAMAGEISDDDLLTRAQKASGQQPEVYSSLTKGSKKFDFTFDNHSTLTVLLLSPGRPLITAYPPPSNDQDIKGRGV